MKLTTEIKVSLSVSPKNDSSCKLTNSSSSIVRESLGKFDNCYCPGGPRNGPRNSGKGSKFFFSRKRPVNIEGRVGSLVCIRDGPRYHRSSILKLHSPMCDLETIFGVHLRENDGNMVQTLTGSNKCLSIQNSGRHPGLICHPGASRTTSCPSVYETSLHYCALPTR